VPIFVLTHHPPESPPKQDERLTFTFVTDGLASAIEQAKMAAGDKPVQVVGGASVAQQLLRAGLVRLLENSGPELVQLRKVAVQEVGARTSLRFRVA
jgi:dihydrofolate reductase